ncbi:MAG: hypothetical protein L0H79_11210 [Intrasporangium sp.]|uniref:hypothetical protein n=1 Tax=Intrasporangium sp. TaxID=1925024 RepID=UPI00264978F9|nr:hypothetical protein [Intrasporangium sp.]MDN5796303.1 hypothetical protein [Intrasporangium sp.]
MPELPACVRVALWTTIAWRGDIALPDAIERSLPDVDHVTGIAPTLQAWGDIGERALLVALPRPGCLDGLPRCAPDAAGHAAQAGECVHVAGAGGVLVPTLTEYGPDGDTGVRIDWTGYDAEPTPRHRLEMLDLRQTERELLDRMRHHSEQFESAGGHPWEREARAEAEAGLRHSLWGLPEQVPDKALHVMAIAAGAAQLADRGRSLTGLGSHGVDATTAGRREQLLRSLGSDADRALAEATNVAVMVLAGWRSA